MKSVYNFVVTPVGERYNNTKKIGGLELVLNTEIFTKQYPLGADQSSFLLYRNI